MNDINKANMVYGISIRFLHSLLALCCIAQLAIGELMDVPGAADEPVAAMAMISTAHAHGGVQHAGNAIVIVEETLGFEVHEILGLTIAALLFIRLLLAEIVTCHYYANNCVIFLTSFCFSSYFPFRY